MLTTNGPVSSLRSEVGLLSPSTSPSQLQVETDRLQSLVISLRTEVNMLIDRLAPVLKPAMDSPGEVEKSPSPVRCLVADFVSGQCDQVETLADLLRETRLRVDC